MENIFLKGLLFAQDAKEVCNSIDLDECGYILKGRLKVVIDDGSGNLSTFVKEPGDVFHFPPGLIHQEEALELYCSRGNYSTC